MSIQLSAAPSRTTPVGDQPDATHAVFTSPEKPVVHPSATGIVSSNPYIGGGGRHVNNKVDAGAIAGGVVGGLAVISIAVVALYWVRRRYRYSQRREMDTEVVSHPPAYTMPRSMEEVQPPTQAVQPVYVYKNEGVSVKEEKDPFADEKHVEAGSVDKKL